MFFIPRILDAKAKGCQINCNYDFGGDGTEYITPFVYNYICREAAALGPRKQKSATQLYRSKPTDSAVGVPSYATKKALTQSLVQFHRVGVFKPRINYNATIAIEYDDGCKELPIDAVLTNENGDNCMIFMFYKYPFVTDWIKNIYQCKHGDTLREIGDRLLRLDCAYCIVDDGFSSMIVGIKATVINGLNSWDRSQMPVLFGPSDPRKPTCAFFDWWILKAVENVEKHKQIFEENVTDDWNIFDTVYQCR